MRKAFAIVSVLLIITILACSFSASTANIDDAKMAQDAEGNEPTTVFSPDDTFFALVELVNALEGTSVKAVWTAVEADGIDPNTSLDEAELDASSGQLYFELSNDNQWPVGTYKVDLYLNDELDRTLEFEVEGSVAAVEPDSTATPEDTPTPAPTETTPAQSSTGDTLGGSNSSSSDDEVSDEDLADDEVLDEDSADDEEAEPEALPFQAEPYVHPSGAFTFAVPQDWELGNEGEFIATFGGNNSLVGTEFFNADMVYDEELMQTFIELYLNEFIISGEYEILSQQVQSDDSIYVAVASESPEGDRVDSDFFFEQQDTIVFILYFSSLHYDDIQPTWDEIIASYSVDLQAALTVAPAATPTSIPTPTPQPLPPTATPVPAPVVNPYAPLPGQARVYLQNKFGSEYNIDFGDGGGSIQVVPGAENFYHDIGPGSYRPGLSIAGGNAINIDITVGADQSFTLIVGGDGRLSWGQIYP